MDIINLTLREAVRSVTEVVLGSNLRDHQVNSLRLTHNLDFFTTDFINFINMVRILESIHSILSFSRWRN